jgi:hypothetical protein
MSARIVQAVIGSVVLVFAIGPSRASADGLYAQQLRRECDELLELAVKRQYGLAWTPDLRVDPKQRKPEVEMDAPGSAGAGLVLLWAGDLLKEPRYVEAGVLVARGVAAAQTSNGNIPSRPQFGPTPGARREPPTAVPDRSATRAGLVLMLGAAGADPQRDDMLHRSARRAAQWLARQQTRDGAWPTTAPAGAEMHEHRRLIRLDTSDARDTTFALLLAADALDDPLLSRAARQSVDKLISLRLAGPQRVENLWSTFYQLNGAAEDGLADWPPGADVLASRRAMEVLIAASLLLQHESAQPVAREAAAALSALRAEEGTWRRLYPLNEAHVGDNSIFGAPGTQPSDELWTSGTFSIEPVLRAVDWLNRNGPLQLADHLASGPPLQERLAAAACGLHDEPLYMDWPGEAAQVDSFVKAHELRWRLVEGVPPEDLRGRLRRIYALLLRARVEAQFGKDGG